MALWPARMGSVGSTAPGGTVMLEDPIAFLPKDSIDYKKVGKAGAPISEIETTTGDVKLVFFIPVEGKEKTEFFEVTLKLKLGDFPAPSPGRTWLSRPEQEKPK